MSAVKSALIDAEYIVADLLGRPGMLSEDDVRSLAIVLFKERHPNIAEAADYFVDRAITRAVDLERY